MSQQLQPLIFLGASAYSEIAEVMRDINAVRPTYRPAGILDDNAALHGQQVQGAAVLGPLELVAQHPEAQFVLGIGSYRSRLVRHEIVRRLGLPLERYAALIHPAARIFSSSTVGHGCILHAGTVICNDTVLEDLVVMLPNCVIGARNIVCEGALLAAGVKTTGDAALGHYCHIGLGSLIGVRHSVGAGAQVAMGSVVLRDVPPGVMAMGNPARNLDRSEVPPELLARWEQTVATLPERWR